MAFFEWNDSLSVGITEFDAHHKRLVELINNLHDENSGGHSRIVVGNTLLALSNYVIYHFLAEEDVMHRHHYPDYEPHRQEHIALTEKTLGFVAAFHRGAEDITSELLNFLVAWLKNHIMTVDKKYQGFLNNKGMH
ncbi:MAG: hemerythrin [Thermodesulfovibrio sp.]|nr:hemerythrin [Thermodesulfovibrio sp.]